jgi:hypothetical protein
MALKITAFKFFNKPYNLPEAALTQSTAYSSEFILLK